MRQTKLASQARDLQRQIFASLPINIRLAHFYLRIAALDDASFGKMLFAYFIKSGVTDIPELKGPVSLDDLREMNINQITRKLPKSYAAGLGRYVKGTVNKFLKTFNIPNSSEVLENAMSHILMKIIRSTADMKDRPFGDARSYIITSMKNYIRDHLRGMYHNPETSTPVDSEGVDIEFADPKSMINALKGLPRHEMHKLWQELSRSVAKTDLQQSFLEMKLQGYTYAEIARELGTSHSAVRMFFERNSDRITSIMEEYI